jgi:hypothetical protein
MDHILAMRCGLVDRAGGNTTPNPGWWRGGPLRGREFEIEQLFLCRSYPWYLQRLSSRTVSSIRKTGKYFFVLFCTYLPLL